MATQGGRHALKRRLPWLALAGAALCAVGLPFLPHVLAAGAIDTPERLDPGLHEFVHGSFDVFAGDLIEGHVTALEGPPVTLYIMDAGEFEGLRVASLTNASLTLTGTDLAFSFRVPTTGTYHLVVGHSPGNESSSSSLHVQASVAASLPLTAFTLVSEAAGVSLLLFGIRRHAQAVLAEREAARKAAREAARDGPRSKRRVRR